MAGGGKTNWTADRIARLAGLAAAGETDARSAKVLGVSRSAIAGARLRFNIPSANYDYPRRGIPSDFASIAPTLTTKQSAAHFQASPNTIRNWLKRLNLTAAIAERAPKPVVVTQSYEAPRRTCGNSTIRRFSLPDRGATAAAQAQLFLQRYGPVFRASTINPNATGWIMFGRRVSEADLIATAYRKGFRAEAMAA